MKDLKKKKKTIQYLLLTQLKPTRVKIILLLEVSQAEVDCKIPNNKRLNLCSSH